MVLHLLKRSILSFCTKCVSQKVPLRSVAISAKSNASSTLDAEEVKKFDNEEWWNENNLLHLYNSLRVPLIRDGILSVAKKYQKAPNPLAGYRILDVGCGGGILSEPLARLGAEVTGLDPGARSIEIARERASKDPEISGRITYICDTIENLTTPNNDFEAVVCSEVVEHVNDVQAFVGSCVELTKTGGSLFFTTINRTNISYFLSILMAEYAMGLLPKGTHDWNKFVKPEELTGILESLNCRIVSVEGVAFNPIMKKFVWCGSRHNLYALHAVKL